MMLFFGNRIGQSLLLSPSYNALGDEQKKIVQDIAGNLSGKRVHEKQLMPKIREMINKEETQLPEIAYRILLGHSTRYSP